MGPGQAGGRHGREEVRAIPGSLAAYPADDSQSVARAVSRPGFDGGSGVSLVLRGLDFWILVSDTRRK